MRTQFSKLAFAAALGLALAFTFGCSSSYDGDSGGGSGGGGCGIAQTPSNLPRSSTSTSHDPYEECKNIVFNASTNFCYDGIVYDKCNGMGYNPSTHICQGTAAYPAVCGSSSYNPLEQGCCRGSIFDPSYERCHKDEDAEDDEDGYLEIRCGESWYSYYNFNKCCTWEYGKGTRVVDCPSTVTNGELMTDKGGRTYETVVIGEQTWMAKNLDYAGPCNDTGICYDYDYKNCTTYGRLYNLETAMKVCPDGWHLPSNEEWSVLIEAAGGWESLKSKRGWRIYNGTNAYGFSALPGGYVEFYRGQYYFMYIGAYGDWWTTDRCDNADDWDYGDMTYDGCIGEFLSVRCLKDN